MYRSSLSRATRDLLDVVFIIFGATLSTFATLGLLLNGFNPILSLFGPAIVMSPIIVWAINRY